MTSSTIELIKVIPSALWALFFFVALFAFYRPICDELFPKLSGFKALGVELSFVSASMNAAIELAEKSPYWKVEVSIEQKSLVLRRARRHLDLFLNANILWVDDHPENNVNERRMFRQLRAEVDVARSTEEATRMLRVGSYDLVLSDMNRDEDSSAGLKALPIFRGEKNIPVVFYIGVIDPDKGVPPHAFGITNRPDELLNLTLDALERTKS
jgi:CheY-like chemotaxis protein